MKDCRTCEWATDQYFCKRVLNPDVAEWIKDTAFVKWDDIKVDCPGHSIIPIRGNQVPDKTI